MIPEDDAARMPQVSNPTLIGALGTGYAMLCLSLLWAAAAIITAKHLFSRMTTMTTSSNGSITAFTVTSNQALQQLPLCFLFQFLRSSHMFIQTSMVHNRIYNLHSKSYSTWRSFPSLKTARYFATLELGSRSSTTIEVGTSWRPSDLHQSCRKNLGVKFYRDLGLF